MIVLDDLWKRYPSGPWVAQGISAVFPAGQATALLGRNGAGKSSLLALIVRNAWWLIMALLTLALLLALLWYLRQVSLRRLPVPGFFLIVSVKRLIS